MLGTYSLITDRAALYAATGDHPWVRMTTRNGDGVGYRSADVIGWVGGRPDRATAGALGDGKAAIDLVLALLAQQTIAPGTRLELPRMDHAIVHSAFPDVHVVDWDLRWLQSVPPIHPGEEQVEALSEADFPEINEILDAALPDAHNRPGAPRIIAWYGIRRDGRLVAVAADSSTPGFGFLNSIAVRPELHGSGLGSILTCRLARDQQSEHGLAMLGVWSENVNASRLYHRLGYTGLHEITAFTLPG